MIVIGLAILGGVALTQIENEPVEFTAPQVIEKEVEVDMLEEAVKKAQEATRANMEQVAQQAYDDAFTHEMKKVELEVIKDFNKQLNERQIELEKETKVYWTRERVIGLIKQTFPEDAERALAVAHCESGLKPSAYNPNNKNGSTDGGLWQINSVHDKTLETLGLDKYDPEDATKFARILYEKNGWRDWVCYTHNKIVMR